MPIILVYGNHYDIWELLILNKLLCYVMLCFVMLCYVMLCYVMLCYAMLCYAMLCYAMLCYVMLTSIAYASENLKTFADLSRCSDRRSSLVYVVT